MKSAILAASRPSSPNSLHEGARTRPGPTTSVCTAAQALFQAFQKARSVCPSASFAAGQAWPRQLVQHERSLVDQQLLRSRHGAAQATRPSPDSCRTGFGLHRGHRGRRTGRRSTPAPAGRRSARRRRACLPPATRDWDSSPAWPFSCVRPSIVCCASSALVSNSSASGQERRLCSRRRRAATPAGVAQLRGERTVLVDDGLRLRERRADARLRLAGLAVVRAADGLVRLRRTPADTPRSAPSLTGRRGGRREARELRPCSCEVSPDTAAKRVAGASRCSRAPRAERALRVSAPLRLRLVRWPPRRPQATCGRRPPPAPSRRSAATARDFEALQRPSRASPIGLVDGVCQRRR